MNSIEYAEYLASDHWKNFKESYRRIGYLHQCVGCDVKEYQLHHIRYENLGKEMFSDVVPLCKKCHEEIHRVHYFTNIPLDRPDLALMKIFQWTVQQTKEKFKYIWLNSYKLSYPKINKLKNKKKKIKQKKETINRFCKTPSNIHEIRRFIKSGYTIKQIAERYEKKERYVLNIIKKWSDFFEE